jgi:two-component system, OmpR family, sensor histidine kinase VicK
MIEEIEAIYRNALRFQKLTNDILDVSRIESRTLNLHKEVFNLNELISRIVQDYRSYVRHHNGSMQLFSITSQNGDCELIVEADRNRINLINNAIKFTSQKGGIIAIKTEKRNDKGENQEVIIDVKDTGEGIHPEIIPRLLLNLQPCQTQALV